MNEGREGGREVRDGLGKGGGKGGKGWTSEEMDEGKEGGGR